MLHKIMLLLSATVLLVVSGCSPFHANLKEKKCSEMGYLKGLSTEKLVEEIGPANSKKTGEEMETWIYKMPASNPSSINTMEAWSTFGIMSGQNAPITDVMNLTVKRGKVAKVTCAENVLSLNAYGLSDAETKQIVTAVQGEKPPVEKVIERAAPAAPAVQNKPAPMSKQAATTMEVKTKKFSQNFPGKVAKLHKKILLHLKKNGVSMNEVKPASLAGTSEDGDKIVVTLKQLKTEVAVNIAATGSSSSRLLEQIDSVFECCKK